MGNWTCPRACEFTPAHHCDPSMILQMPIERPTIFHSRCLYAWLHDNQLKQKHPSVYLLVEYYNISHHHRLGQTSRPFNSTGTAISMDVWVRTKLYASAISMVGVTPSSYVETLLVGGPTVSSWVSVLMNPWQKWLHEIRIPQSLLGEQLGALVDAEEMLDEAVRLFMEVISDIQEK